MRVEELLDRLKYLINDNDTYTRGLLFIDDTWEDKYKVYFNNNEIFIIKFKDQIELECKTYNRTTIKDCLDCIMENYKYEVSTRGCKNDILEEEILKLEV